MIRTLVAAQCWRRSAATAATTAWRAQSTTATAPSPPATGAAADPLDAAFRTTMRHQAFPVAVLGAASNSTPRAFRYATISSFTSVALCPATVSFALRIPSRMTALLQQQPRQPFLVHLLAHDQAGLAAQYAVPATQQVMPPSVEGEVAGVPVVGGCLAVLECVAGEALEVADHTVWFAEVRQVVVPPRAGVKSLVYVNREYTTTADRPGAAV
ncbi:hypothetical protein GGF31_005000 [Allomyces arbusculus]|nr:hypothetical protein GGF31_005000 [Allomyces arbusculus]